MPEEYRNIYKIARRAKGYTQEAAAERLGISTESIRAYETGLRVPPNEVVQLMALCYDATYLPYQHLMESNKLAQLIIPSIEERSILAVAVSIYNRLREFDAKHSVERLLAIAEDNCITEEERAEFDGIVSDLREILKCSMELQVYGCAPGQTGGADG